MAGLQDMAPTVAKLVCHQCRSCAHARGRRRGFAAGMAAADHHDVETSLHGRLEDGVVAEAGEGVKSTNFRKMFHVKHLEVADCWAYPQTGTGPNGIRVLFADAEIAEDDVENVLDIDAAGQTSERLAGGAQLLGQQILAAGTAPARAAKRPRPPAKRGDGARG